VKPTTTLLPFSPAGTTSRVTLRPVDPAGDLETVHTWMHHDHVRAFWRMAWPRPRLAAYLQGQVDSAHLTPWIAAVDGRDLAYVETYVVAGDPLADHIEVEPGDRGWHVLVGPADALGTGHPRLVGRAVLSMLFSDPAVGRVLCEPDVRNERMIAFCCRHLAHRPDGEVELPDKRAAVLVCTRDAHAQRFGDDLTMALGGPR
jgi:acetyl CoA:N6-hydroxylysine acetyl transferase